jgi:hypothetical protein
MRKALAGSVALASILFLLVVACAPARATDYTVGLTVGSTATYSASTTFTNETSLTMVVTWTNTTALTVASVDHFANGTTQNRFDTWDVRYGPGGNITLAVQWLWVIAANLNVSDHIVMSGSAATFNSSTTMVVAGAIRTVNLWQLEQDFFGYWDKSTGLLAKLNMNWGPIIGWFNFTLTSTTAWTGLPAIPGYPLEAIGLALALGVSTGLIYRHKRPQYGSPP